MSDADAPFLGRPCPDWYARPQLGIFIHWGLFAVPAWAPAGVSITDLFKSDYDSAMAVSPYAEWYWNAMRVPGSPTARHHAEVHGGRPYGDFRAPFEAAASAFSADAWADLFVASGARYVVLVTKHHDGFCLWPSDVDNPNAPGWRSSRDHVGELAAAVRARGLRFGLYYSGGLDWTFRDSPISDFGDMFACVPTDAAYRAYAAAQVRELVARYRPSVLWNDIAWPAQEDLPSLFADYYADVPDGVVNDRWMASTALFEGLREPAARKGFNDMVKGQVAASSGELASPAPWHCDFRTVEYAAGAHMGAQKWEACRGLGLAFGYNQAERPEDFMTGDQLVALYRDTTARGGNLLINVGPMADGTIPETQQRPLLELGRVIARS
jgi:alpha-L-fucosidase